MASQLSRRHLLNLAAITAAGTVLAACSDSSTADTSAAQANGVDPITTAAVDVPKSDGSVDMSKLLEAGNLKEMVVGQDDAPVTIVEYASMTCSHCADFTVNTLPVIKEKYIDSGKARLIFREFPFDPRAAAAFMLARCAPEERYFPMVDVLFKQQAQWAMAENAQEALLKIAKLAGFTQETFNACLTDQKLLDDVNAVRERGSEFGVNATPTFFINGKKYSGALSVEQMSAVIDSLL